MVRIKNRYLLLKASPGNGPKQETIDSGKLTEIVHAAVRQLFGIVGSGSCLRTSALYANLEGTGVAIVRTRFERTEMVGAGRSDAQVKTAIAHIGHSDMPFPYAFDVVHVSGTIRSCKKSAVKLDRQAEEVEN